MLGTLKSLFERTTQAQPTALKSPPVDSASVAPPRPPQPVLQPEAVPQVGPNHGGQPVPMYPRLGPAVPGVAPVKLVATQDKLIRELRQASSLSYEEFDLYILPAVVLFAEYVHLLPASEYDHHSDLGGLFRHGLEVALNASRRAEGKEFALNEVPSVRKFQIARWRACALLGGMLHDIGKAVIDVGAKNVEGDKVWNPHVQPLWRWMTEHDVDQYMIRWRETRRHKEHDAISATVLVRIIPEPTMRWLGEYGGRAAYDAMLMALTGSSDRSNPLIDIIKNADQDSVQADRQEAQRRLAAVGEAGSRSDAAVLVRAMRDLILKGTWQVNTLGHIVWHTERGIYVMYPQCAKEAVEHLRETNVSTTLPNEPAVILEVLRNAGIVVQNALPNGKAYDLHRVRIYCKERDGSELALDMTALKFANDRIIPDYYSLPTVVHIDICDPDGKVLDTSRPQEQQPIPSQSDFSSGAEDLPPSEEPSAGEGTASTTPETAPTPTPTPVPPNTQTPSKQPDVQSGQKPSAKKEGQKKKEKKAPVDHLAALAEQQGLQDEESHPSSVFNNVDAMMDDDEGDAFPQPVDDTPLRDRANERDARDALIEDTCAEMADPFPPTSKEGAELWLKGESQHMYISWLVKRITKGELKAGVDFNKEDGELLFKWPSCMDGNGIDPGAMIDAFSRNKWLASGKKVHSIRVGSEFEPYIRFSYGVSRVIELLCPNDATEEPGKDVGPYMPGARGKLFAKSGLKSPLGQAIFQAAFYKYLEDLYGKTEGGIAGQSPKQIHKDLDEFIAMHAADGIERHGVRSVVIACKGGTNPLTKESTPGTVNLNPDYERHTDELEVQKALG